MVPVDWDQDGDLDLWTSNRNAPRLRFMQNRSAERVTKDHPANFLLLKLLGNGTTTNRDAIGARVEITLSNPETQSEDSAVQVSDTTFIKSLRAGEGFLSQGSKWLHFGLGKSSQIDKVVVRWPGGDVQEFMNLEPNRRYRLTQDISDATLWERSSEKMQISTSPQDVPLQTDTARIPLIIPLPLPSYPYLAFGKQRQELPVALGEPLLLNLWASWCTPCLKELREFTDREQDLRKRGLNIVALSVDDLGDHHGKLDIIDCVLALGTGSVRDRIRLAELYFSARRPEDGARQYRAAVDQLDRARIDAPVDVTRDFQRVAERYLYHKPDDVDVSKRLAASYLDTQEAARALPRLRLAQRSTPRDLEVLDLLAQSFDQLGQDHKAVTVYQEMATLYGEHGLERDRDRCYRKILHLNATHAKARQALGEHESDVTGRTILFEPGSEAARAEEAAAPKDQELETLMPASERSPSATITSDLSREEVEELEDVDVAFGDPQLDDLTVVDHTRPEPHMIPSERVPAREREVSFDEPQLDGLTVIDPDFIPAELRGGLDNTDRMEVTSEAPTAGEMSISFDDELRELDFYIKNGFEEDARALFDELREAHGNHPAILARAEAVGAPQEERTSE